MPSTITFSILVRLYRRSGYQEEQAVAAVANLFQVHGLPLREDMVRDTDDGRRNSKGRGKGMKKGKGPSHYMEEMHEQWPERDDRYARYGAPPPAGPPGKHEQSSMWAHSSSPNLQPPPLTGANPTGSSYWSQSGQFSGPHNDAYFADDGSNLRQPAWNPSKGGYDQPPHINVYHDTYQLSYPEYSSVSPSPPTQPGVYPMEERADFVDWIPRTPEQYASHPGY